MKNVHCISLEFPFTIAPLKIKIENKLISKWRLQIDYHVLVLALNGLK